MRLEIENGRKINLATLRDELGADFVVIQESCSVTTPDKKTVFKPLIIEVKDDAKTKIEDLQKICDRHAPIMTDAEEAQAKRTEAQNKEDLDKIKPQVEAVLDVLLSDKDFLKRLKAKLNES